MPAFQGGLRPSPQCCSGSFPSPAHCAGCVIASTSALAASLHSTFAATACHCCSKAHARWSFALLQRWLRSHSPARSCHSSCMVSRFLRSQKSRHLQASCQSLRRSYPFATLPPHFVQVAVRLRSASRFALPPVGGIGCRCISSSHAMRSLAFAAHMGGLPPPAPAPPAPHNG